MAGLFSFLGQANVLFCTGHVESPTLKFLFEDTSNAALVRCKSLRTTTDHRRSNSSPNGCA